ncbi:acyl-CoA dehydrogenase family protein [Staphylospora marina]|uniref:acyl-CoA dehydrogenase family protein n=1 Tax=Staphylospora marina TaxID=2490858 RepID=UPI000F5B926B|nr:acyl-CoA dehydrogenase family protein [Staphylospora marina]
MTRPYLKEEHELFRRSLRRFLEKEAVPSVDRWEREGLIPRSFWLKLGANGFLAPGVEPKYGGLGADFGYSVVIIEELERVVSGLQGVALHNEIVVPYLQHEGTEVQKKRWLPSCVTGQTITAIAMTEPGAGSDLASIRTTAVKDGNHWVINGQKTFISNGIHADLVIVAVKTDPHAQPPHRGISLIVVEDGTPGFVKGRKLEKMGLRSQDTAELYFEDCRVPVDHLLGEEGRGFAVLMKHLERERLVLAIGAQTAAEEMLRMTVEYVRRREAFGRTLDRHQHVRFRLAELATEVELGRTFVDHAVTEFISGRRLGKKAAMAKWWVTEMARRLSVECLQLHGGYGYMEEYPIARRVRDIAVAPVYAGTTEIMKELVARELFGND